MPDNDKAADSSNQPSASNQQDTLTPTDLATHQQLTQALHTLDLLNAQLGVAGALLVSFYHLQRQREALAAQQAAPQYPAPGAYPPAPGAPYPQPAQAPAPQSYPQTTTPPPPSQYPPTGSTIPSNPQPNKTN